MNNSRIVFDPAHSDQTPHEGSHRKCGACQERIGFERKLSLLVTRFQQILLVQKLEVLFP